jgi:uncharacterized membrane protein YgaE (UPF0421/DUF939 family)
MIGGIIAVAIALWYYRSAEARGLPNFQWALAGLIAFYVPNFIWSLAIAKPMMNTLHAQNATATASFWGFSSVFVGAVVAILVHIFILKRAASASHG